MGVPNLTHFSKGSAMDSTMFKSQTPNVGSTLAHSEPTMMNLAASSASDTKPTNPNRCGGCRKKLALTDFECRCKTRFCALHRAPEEHACTFDFKSHGLAHLEKQLTKAVADKVERF
jgi:predicted nucleic acid binding AN1-type Zn finger protein